MGIPASRFRSLSLSLSLLCLVLPLTLAEPARAGGLIVETVGPGDLADVAGLRAGDRLTSWRFGAAPGGPDSAPAETPLRTPFDLLWLRVEESPRRAVVLAGRRGDEPLEWTLRGSDWGMQAVPDFPGRSGELFAAGGAAKAAGDYAAMERSWRALLEAERPGGETPLLAWLRLRLASSLAIAGQGDAADALFAEALAGIDGSAEPRVALEVVRSWGESLERRGLVERAGERYTEALERVRAFAPDSLLEAALVTQRGRAAAGAGNNLLAKESLERALTIREAVLGESPEVVGALNNLGILAHRMGDTAGSEAYYLRGLQLLERVAPASPDRGLFALNLGNLEEERGNFERAEELLRQALEIFERAAPDGENTVNALVALAEVANRRGAFAEAEAYLRRALDFQRRRPLTPPELRNLLVELGNIQSRRGDFAGAEDQFRRALEIQEGVEPDGLAAAMTLGSLGNIEVEQGKLEPARAHLERALAIRERLEPETRSVATTLENLGRFEVSGGGNLALGESRLRRSLAILEKIEANPLDRSDVLLDLARVAERLGRPEAAVEEARQALALRRSRVPGSIDEAEALYELGRLSRLVGREEEGGSYACAAVEVLDHQRGSLGGTATARASFEATLGDYYSACLASLLRAHQEERAFGVLERGRARAFLDLLAGRDLRPADLPPELAAERRRLDRRNDEAQGRLRELQVGPGDAAIQRIGGELRELEVESEALAARVRQASPRAGALREPRPVDLAGARSALDRGTLLVEYAVGEERSWVFAVRPAGDGATGLVVREIAAGRAALAVEVEAFRRQLEDPASAPAALKARARRLYDLLLGPVEGSLRGARRLLISPDGPLHVLPFAALRSPGGRGSRGSRGSARSAGRYLVERLPLHVVLSATVYAELRRSRPSGAAPPSGLVAAFGDPAYGDAAAPARATPAVGEALRRGLKLSPLPGTREEVREIAALFPGARTYLGRDATEERAKALGPRAGIVHFACHGYLDERFPLSSSLALSLPETQKEGEENGLLQAWEIFEGVRLDAGLVTLSACDAGLGKEMGGEGLIGLVRAFQFAGARSVLAGQWSVADASTSELMRRFYRHLRSGATKDQALRRAQLDLLRRAPRAHPFHWAAFELFGDWQ